MATARNAIVLLLESAGQLAAPQPAPEEAPVHVPAGMAGSGWPHDANPIDPNPRTEQGTPDAFVNQEPQRAQTALYSPSPATRSFPAAVVRTAVAPPSTIQSTLARPPLQRTHTEPTVSNSGDAFLTASGTSGTWSVAAEGFPQAPCLDLPSPSVSLLPSRQTRRALMPLHALGELDHSLEDDEQHAPQQNLSASSPKRDHHYGTSSSCALTAVSTAGASHELPSAGSVLSHSNSTSSSDTIDLDDHLGDLRSPGSFNGFHGTASTSFKRHASMLGGSASQEPTPTKDLFPRSASSASSPPNADDGAGCASATRNRRGRPTKRVVTDAAKSSAKRPSSRRRVKGKPAQTNSGLQSFGDGFGIEDS